MEDSCCIYIEMEKFHKNRAFTINNRLFQAFTGLFKPFERSDVFPVGRDKYIFVMCCPPSSTYTVIYLTKIQQSSWMKNI